MSPVLFAVQAFRCRYIVLFYLHVVYFTYALYILQLQRVYRWVVSPEVVHIDIAVSIACFTKMLMHYELYWHADVKSSEKF